MPETAEAAPASSTGSDPIAAAREALFSRFEEVIASPSGPVNTASHQSSADPAQPGGDPAPAPEGNGQPEGATRGTEQTTGQPDAKATEPAAKEQEEQSPKVSAADRLKEDKELHDHVQRLLQSERDRTTAALNKATKNQQAVAQIKTTNAAFAQDWDALPSESRLAWMEEQPEFKSAVQTQLSATAKALADDLLDLLGADKAGVTEDMLAPTGRDALRDYLLGGKAVEGRYATKLQAVKDEAFKAGKAAAMAELRGQEKTPPAGSVATPTAPKTAAEARQLLLDHMDRMGL